MNRTLPARLGNRLAAVTLSLSMTLGLGGLGTLAHAQDVVMKSSEVTESSLIDALAIDGPTGPEGAKTRGFRAATRTGGDNKGPVAKPGPGKASLLITFVANSAELSPETMATLDVLARALQSDTLAGFTFKVEGHADPRGDAARNLVLSQERADAVANYLVTKHAILSERLQPVGKGSSELLNKTRVDAPENRRVTIVTIKG